MPTAEDMAPRTPEICVGCGKPLGAGPWWFTADGGRHEACVDWSARKVSPLSLLLRRLRRLRARLMRAVRAVDRAGIVVAMLEKRWPQDALPGLERARRAVAELERKLRELSVEVKW